MKFDISRIANLARLKLTPAEKKKFEPQLKSILKYVEQISKVKTDGVVPTFQTTDLKDAVSDDRVDRGRVLSQEEVLSSTPDKKDGFFKVKRVSKS